MDTPAALAAMAERLASTREVAVDLEHHSHRSFQGFTCLMQLSTRSEDFVVDTIALRSEIGVAPHAPVLLGLYMPVFCKRCVGTETCLRLSAARNITGLQQCALIFSGW